MKQIIVLSAALVPFTSVQSQHQHGSSPATIKTEIVSPLPSAGKSAPVVIRLTDSRGKPVTFDDLKVAHTEKLHLLIVDESLSDYHHEHPKPAEKPGEYRFAFDPRFGGEYRLWADVVPVATGKQEFSRAGMRISGSPAPRAETTNMVVEDGNLRFELSTEDGEPLRVGKASLVKAKVTKDGRDFTELEPIMGAFAHVVAFPSDRESIAHVHPMGKEPKEATERGGPLLSFHIAPEKPGYHKIFLQTQIDGRDHFAAFGMKIEPAEAAAASKTGEYVCPMHPEVKTEGPSKCPKCGMDLVKK